MKIKLLKKVRKRFSWYFRSNGDIILVDHQRQTHMLINNDYVIRNYGKEPEVGFATMKYRALKESILKPFINDPLTKILYRKSSIKSGRKPVKTL